MDELRGSPDWMAFWLTTGADVWLVELREASRIVKRHTATWRNWQIIAETVSWRHEGSLLGRNG